MARRNPEIGAVRLDLTPSDALRLVSAVEAQGQSGSWPRLRKRIADAIIRAAYEENPAPTRKRAKNPKKAKRSDGLRRMMRGT